MVKNADVAMAVASRALLAAADAGVTWWRGKKPVGWGVEKHLANPTVNCVSYREKMLARRAAKWFAVTRGIEL